VLDVIENRLVLTVPIGFLPVERGLYAKTEHSKVDCMGEHD
jgi:hypothetical protein